MGTNFIVGDVRSIECGRGRNPAPTIAGEHVFAATIVLTRARSGRIP